MAGESIDLTPTPDAYQQLARVFIESQASDYRPDRRAAALSVLDGLINIAVYFGTLPDAWQRGARLKAEIARAQSWTPTPDPTPGDDGGRCECGDKIGHISACDHGGAL